MNNILHHIPGHLRLNSRAFNRAACDPAALKSSLETLPGVSSVELHSHAEDLIILYDPTRLTPVTLMDKVARHGIAALGPKLEHEPIKWDHAAAIEAAAKLPVAAPGEGTMIRLDRIIN